MLFFQATWPKSPNVSKGHQRVKKQTHDPTSRNKRGKSAKTTKSTQRFNLRNVVKLNKSGKAQNLKDLARMREVKKLEVGSAQQILES